MGRELDRRTFLKGSALGLAGAAVPGSAIAGHWPPPDPNRPPGHHDLPGGGGGTDEGDLPQPSELPDRPEPTIRTEHDRGTSRHQGRGPEGRQRAQVQDARPGTAAAAVRRPALLAPRRA